MLGYCGNLAIGKDASNGQTVKTRIVLEEIKKNIHIDEIEYVDTVQLREKPAREMIRLIGIIRKSSAMVILPAHSAIKVLAFLLYFCKKEHRTYYVVIGGWLPEMLKKNKWLFRRVSNYKGIYVETKSMLEKMVEMGFHNVYLLPNCKPLKPIIDKGLYKKYVFCTFSRVSKEKGIELAIEAVKKVKEKLYDFPIELDIYGKPDEDYKYRFESICRSLPEFVHYRGVRNANESQDCLKDNYALLFPTYYSGEGFPGTIIDAFSAGLPVLASDWKYNAEIVQDGMTGYIYKANDLDALVVAIERAIKNEEEIDTMRVKCIKEAKKYTPENAIHDLVIHLKQ